MAAMGVARAQFPFSDAAAYAAKAETITGQVSVLKDSQPWALQVGDLVHVQQMIFTGADGHALFRVSDGSTFEVYPNSRVVFRKNPPNWRDMIDLLVGRVRVHIEHFGSTPNPNRVLTPTAVISVRGTTFDVEVGDEDETTLIEVEEGLVEVRHALLPSNDAKLLQGGESMRVYRSQPIAQRTVDKGTVAKYVFKSIMDALATMATRNAGPLPGGGGGGPVGDSGKTTAPPPAPPTAPGGLPPLN